MLAELLAEEAEVARLRLGRRIDGIAVSDHNVDCRFADRNGRRHVLRLDCRDFDAEPPRLFVVSDTGEVLAGDSWPPGLSAGEHPSLHRPWVCIRGTYEYHVHHSHTADNWSIHRQDIRLADLLGYLLEKCGC